MRSALACLTLLLCFLVTNDLVGQRKHKQRYLDQLEPGSKLINSSYQFSFEQTPDGLFLYKVYFPETKTMTHLMTFSSIEAKVADGPYLEWYDNGNPWIEGQYEVGKRQGNWKHFNYEGEVASYGRYKDDNKYGNWATLNDDGKLKKLESYVGGLRHGPTIYYDSSGQIGVDTFYYERDELIRSTRPDTITDAPEELPIMLSCSEISDSEAAQICSQRTLLENIYGNIRYPAFAREMGISGTAKFAFVVEKDGSINELTVYRGVSKDIRAECLRVIAEMPPWAPGKQLGEEVRVQFKLPIAFRLE